MDKTIIKQLLQNKKLLFAAISGLVLLVIFSVFLINLSQKNVIVSNDNSTKTVNIINKHILTGELDTYPGNELSDHISIVILKNQEINSAPNKTEVAEFTAEIKNFSSSLNDKHEKIASFNIEVSDGRNYSISVLQDPNFGGYYLGSVIKRVDINSETDFVFYDYNEDVDMFGEQLNYKEILDTWSNSQKLKNPSYNTTALSVNSK